MLTIEEIMFLEYFQSSSLHRFREIERFAVLCEKRDKHSSQADKLLTF